MRRSEEIDHDNLVLVTSGNKKIDGFDDSFQFLDLFEGDGPTSHSEASLQPCLGSLQSYQAPPVDGFCAK